MANLIPSVDSTTFLFPEQTMRALRTYLTGFTPEQAVQAIEDYLELHPIEPGASGQSAYELAVAGGFVGSAANWLASLVGADGAPASPQQIADSIAAYFDENPITSGATSNVFIDTVEPTPTAGFGPFIWFELDGDGDVIDIRKGEA